MVRPIALLTSVLLVLFASPSAKAEDPPPHNKGACCLPDGTCILSDPEECPNLGGFYHGNGSTCAQVECCVPCDCAGELCITVPPCADCATLLELIKLLEICKAVNCGDGGGGGDVTDADIVELICQGMACTSFSCIDILKCASDALGRLPTEAEAETLTACTLCDCYPECPNADSSDHSCDNCCDETNECEVVITECADDCGDITVVVIKKLLCGLECGDYPSTSEIIGTICDAVGPDSPCAAPMTCEELLPCVADLLGGLTAAEAEMLIGCSECPCDGNSDCEPEPPVGPRCTSPPCDGCTGPACDKGGPDDPDDPDPTCPTEDTGGGSGANGGDTAVAPGEDIARAYNSVDLTTGHKSERVVDLSIKLVGRDFRLVRDYTSDPGVIDSLPGLVGHGWTMNVFQYLQFDAVDRVSAVGYPMDRSLIYRDTNADGVFAAGGSTAQRMQTVTRTIGSETIEFWRLEEPGSWAVEYYGQNPTTTVEYLHGLIARQEDAYGNSRQFSYRPETDDVLRLSAIDFFRREDSTTPIARAEFEWYPDNGWEAARLRRVNVYRDLDLAQANWTLTQYCEYTYKTPIDTAISDTGSTGDLLQVVCGTAVDLPAGGFWERVTQYRYHDGTMTAAHGTTGDEHQLKMVLRPEQIEYVAQLNAEQGVYPTSSDTALRAGADYLLELADSDLAAHDGQTAFHLSDVAAKIIGYDTTLDTVSEQYLQSGCGCGGGSAQGIRYEYVYHPFESRPFHPDDVKAVEIRESLDPVGDGSYSQKHRTRVYEYAMFDNSKDDALQAATASSPRLIVKAILEPGVSTGGPGRAWATYLTNFTSDLNAQEVYTPSSVAYTFSSLTGKSTITLQDGGLVRVRQYTPDSRLTARGVGTLVGGSLQTTWVERINYPATPTGLQRAWLPDSVERLQTGNEVADEIETTTFGYSFHTAGATSGDLKVVRTVMEAELASENGPGGTYDSFRVYDTEGLVAWSRLEDGTLRYSHRDRATGSMTDTVRNASATAPGGLIEQCVLSTADGPLSDGSVVFTATGWGPIDTSGELVATRVVDPLGRTIKETTAGGVDSYMVRELRELESRHGLLYFATVSLPHQLGPAAFDGPGRVRWINGANSQIGTSSFTIDDSAGYSPGSGLVYAFESTTDTAGEIARARAFHAISGLVTEHRRWQNVFGPGPSPAFYSDTYEYDGIGRLFQRTNDNATILEYPIYDVLNRPLELRVGTTTDTPVTVARYYYDDPDPSDAVHEQGVGNGILNVIASETGDATQADSLTRVTRTYHDFRDRPEKTINPMAPHTMFEYDNLDRLVAKAIFSSDPNSIDQTTDRGDYRTAAFSQRGQRYVSRMSIDPQSPAADTIETHRWFDERGRTVASWAPNSAALKREFDAHGRTTVARTTDRGGDASPGAASSHTDALALIGDTVLEEVRFTYDTDDRISHIETRYRLHDSPTLGALGPTDAVSSFAGYQYDGADRQVREISFGTASDKDLFETGGTLPSSWPPTGLLDHSTTDPDYADTLISATTFNARGLVMETTDPSGQRTRVWYDDLNRLIATAENYTDATISWETDRWAGSSLEADGDRLTSFLYDGSDQVVTRVAHTTGLPNDGVQATQYDYGAALTSANLRPSNDLLSRVRYPDKSTGEPGASSEYWVDYAYNRLGELRTTVDQNGTIHKYHRDDLGRVTEDAATPAAGIHGGVRSIEASFDTLGRLARTESLDISQSVVNAVDFTYTPLWQIDRVYQQHDGAVTAASPYIDYNYANAGMASGNWSRLDRLTYTSATEAIQYKYGSSLNDRISRLDSMEFVGGSSLTQYDYLGSSMIAAVDYPTPDVQLDRTFSHEGKRRTQGFSGQDVGVYPGWDRFGRVKKQAWIDGDLEEHATSIAIPNRPPVYERTHAYDDASNRLSSIDRRTGVAIPSRDFEYEYDGLHRLTEVGRGAWDGTSLIADRGGQEWTLDVLGNWDSFREDKDGDGLFGGLTDYEEDREHNMANELTDLDTVQSLPFEYDDAGNLACAEELDGVHRVYVHDAWNRLVRVEMDDGACTPGGAPIAEYEYNGLHLRTVKRADTNAVPKGTLDQQRIMYYTASWQLLEEHIDDGFTGTHASDRMAHQVWGPRYIDDSVCRRIREFSQGSWGSWEAFWYITDVQFSVVAMIDEFANVIERVVYDAYGSARHYFAGDFNGNRKVDSGDLALIQAAIAGVDPGIDDTGYNADMDLGSSGGPRDGLISIADSLEFLSGPYAYSGNKAKLPAGWVSDPQGIDNPVGYCGHIVNPESGFILARYRMYDPARGRWIEPDVGFFDGSNLFEYVASGPIRWIDPTGEAKTTPEKTKKREQRRKKAVRLRGEIDRNAGKSLAPLSRPCACPDPAAKAGNPTEAAAGLYDMSARLAQHVYNDTVIPLLVEGIDRKTDRCRETGGIPVTSYPVGKSRHLSSGTDSILKRVKVNCANDPCQAAKMLRQERDKRLDSKVNFLRRSGLSGAVARTNGVHGIPDNIKEESDEYDDYNSAWAAHQVVCNEMIKDGFCPGESPDAVEMK